MTEQFTPEQADAIAKLIDILADMVRSWLQQKSHVKEVVLYEPAGTIVKAFKEVSKTPEDPPDRGNESGNGTNI